MYDKIPISNSMEITGEVEREIASLASGLENLTTSQVEPDGKYSYIGVYSNDLHVAERIPSMQRALGVLTSKTSGLRIGLVIGSGGLLSLGKELPQIDTWVVLDKSPGLIEMMKKYYKTVSSATNPQQLIDMSVDFGDAKQTKLDQEKESYGQYHYLENQGNLQRTQEFLAKKKIVFINGNLVDTDFMAKVGNILKSHDAEIAFANFTNVMEWIPGYNEGTSRQKLQSSTEHVPFSRDCVVLFSVSQGGYGLRGKVGRSPLNTQAVIGLERYMKRANL